MIGRTISHYTIVDKLGEGGMGVVYKAEDTKLRRTVALKFLPPESVRDPQAKARFLHEAQAAAALNHSNICTVYEVDEVDGEAFISMALIEGESLENRIARGPLTFQDAIDVVLQTADGLAAAHDKGIVHRDVKPGNIMLTEKSQVKVMDFGLARSPGQTIVTRMGATVGTVAYMSPEQARGERVDDRSDIWSLGVVLYEMITGSRPFRAEHGPGVCYAIIHEEPAPPSNLRTGIPPALEQVITNAMAKQPEERYQRIAELAADLRKVLRQMSGDTVTVAPTGASGRWEMVTAWLARRAVPVAAVAVAVAGLAFYLWFIRLPGDEGPPSSDAGFERVLVAEFENRTDDPSLDYIGERAAASISRGVDSTGEFETVACSAAEAVGAAGLDLGSARGLLSGARAVGASTLVAGSFREESDTLHIEGRILDAADGSVLCAIREESGPLSTPDEAIGRLRSRVMGALVSRDDAYLLRVAGSTAPRYEAYREFESAFGAGGTDSSLVHLDNAVSLDPGFADAVIMQIRFLIWAGRRTAADSLAVHTLSRSGYLSPLERLFVEALAALNNGSHAEALRKLRQLLAAEPECVSAQYLGVRSALRVNRPAEARDICMSLLERNRHAEAWMYDRLAASHHRLGEHDRELVVVRQGIAVYPDAMGLRSREVAALAALGRAGDLDAVIEESASIPVGEDVKLRWGFHRSFDYHIRIRAVEELRAHGFVEAAAPRAAGLVDWQRSRMALEGDTFWPSWRLAYALYYAERWEEARALFDEIEPEDEGMIPVHLCMRGTSAARIGDRETALELKRVLLDLSIEWEPGVGKYFAGSIAAVLGEREEAMDLLRVAVSEGNDIMWFIHYDWDYALLWDYPPFQRFIAPKG